MSELSTVRLKLRHWSSADLAPFAAMNADPEVMQFMPHHLVMDVELITPENAKQYYFPDSVY